MNEENKHTTEPQFHKAAVINSALIPMNDFVLREQKNVMWDSFNRCVRYAIFSKEPLALKMFVPCDENGNYMKEPYEVFEDETEEFIDYMVDYENAKDSILFEGFKVTEEEDVFYIQKNDIEFEYHKNTDMWQCNSEDVYLDIEALAKYSENICTPIKLTDNAIKLIFGQHCL